MSCSAIQGRIDNLVVNIDFNLILNFVQYWSFRISSTCTWNVRHNYVIVISIQFPFAVIEKSFQMEVVNTHNHS